VIDPNVVGATLARDRKLDTNRSRAQARLAKVYNKDNTQFGVIDVDISLIIVEMNGLKFDPPAQQDLKVVLDTAIDGSSTAWVMTTTGKMMGRATVPNSPAVIEMQSNQTGRKEQSAELPVD
jgi:hypothetical protein